MSNAGNRSYSSIDAAFDRDIWRTMIMEIIILTIMTFGLATVITIDTHQKRRAFLNQNGNDQ
jgi:hypothetical protein